MSWTRQPTAALAALAALMGACDDGDSAEEGSACGPTSAVVVRIIDGDTVEVDSGETVRYLLVDTPEVSGEPECYGPQATDFNASWVEGKSVTLEYDVECEDHYGRLLAHVRVDGTWINELMVERGYACVLEIPPNGAEDADDFRALEDTAKAENRGMWGACPEVPCSL